MVDGKQTINIEQSWNGYLPVTQALEKEKYVYHIWYRRKMLAKPQKHHHTSAQVVCFQLGLQIVWQKPQEGHSSFSVRWREWVKLSWSEVRRATHTPSPFSGLCSLHLSSPRELHQTQADLGEGPREGEEPLELQ